MRLKPGGGNAALELNRGSSTQNSRGEDRKVRCLFCFNAWTVSSDDDFETADIRCPKCSVFQTFKDAREEWNQTAEFEFRENRQIRRRRTGVSVHWVKHEKEIIAGRETGEKVAVDYEVDVIHGWILPKRKLIVENEYPYYEIELRPGKPEILTGSQIADRLKLEGRILHRAMFQDVLYHLLRHYCTTEVRVNSTYGIYLDESGALYVDESPVGLSDEQRSAHREIQPGLSYCPTADDFWHFALFNTHFEPDEVLPTMGLSVIAAMSQPIRSHGRMLPHVFNVGPPGTHGLGKSLVPRAYVVIGWGRQQPNEDALESRYRFAAQMDAYCGPQAIGEAENIDSGKIGPMIKNSAENWMLTKRGDISRGDLAMMPYFSREVLFLSGNAFNIKGEAQLARFLCTVFHAERQKERLANKATVDRIVDSLKPVGPSVARKIPQLWPTWQEFNDDRMRLEAEISDCYQGKYQRTWNDPRRAEEWAFCLMGLMAWERAFDDSGVEWQLPAIDEFVRTIVMPVEEMTFRGSRSPLENFEMWFLDFTSMNVLKAEVSTTRIEKGNYDKPDEETTYEYTPKGIGETWERGTIEINGIKRPGVFVTASILERYNNDSAPELRFDSLRSLADTVARVRDVPIGDLLDGTGRVKRVNFTASGRQRAVFIPIDIGEISTPEFEKRRTVKLKVPLNDFSYGGVKYNGKEGEILELVSDLAAQLVRRNFATYTDGEARS